MGCQTRRNAISALFFVHEYRYVLIGVIIGLIINEL